MAIWQFKFSLIPEAGVKRVHGNVPSVLKEYGSFGERPDGRPSELEDCPNYWKGRGVDERTMEKISRLLPPSESWSSDAKMFGDSEKDRIEVWSEDSGDIDVALDVRSMSPTILRGVIDMAKDLECKIVLYGSGEVIDPSLKIIVDKIKLSKAYAFCKSPVQFLSELSARRPPRR